MLIMIKSIISTLVLLLAITLSSCATGAGSLQSYVNATEGYQFLYPNGWLPVDVRNASEEVNVVFHDLIETSENLSVIISEVPKDKNLTDLGTPSEVGYRFFKQVNNDPKSNRETELIRADSQEVAGKKYYILEYAVKLPNQQLRHDIASVAVSHGKLYTFNLSTSELRWPKVKNLFEICVNSFSVY